MKTKRNLTLALALVLALLLAAIPCAVGEEENGEEMRRLRLGNSFYSVMIDDDFVMGEMNDESVAQGQLGCYQCDETGLGFDVLRFLKDDMSDRVSRYALQEAMEYENVVEVRPNETVNGIDIAWYRTVEELGGVEYETLTCIADDGDAFIELVFWMEDEEDAAEARAIINSLKPVELMEIQLGTSPLALVVPDDFRQGDMTEADVADDQVAYWYSDATLLDFDVYQFSKEGLPQDLAGYVAQEASEYPVNNELVTDAKINGVPAGWYRTVEECDEGEYDTLTYILDTGDEYVEVVFWLDGFTAEAEAQTIIQSLSDSRAAEADDDGSETPDGVVPVTWDVTPEHPMIDTDQARALYWRIVAGDYPSMEELQADPVVAQLDALAAYYKALYGNTAEIDTPEREQLRQDTLEWFLTLGSARVESVGEDGRKHYAYDGPLNRDFRMELVLGLPASGKSTLVADPDSEAMGAFVLDPDVIKAALPEYVESHGAAADAVHFEGMGIFQRAVDAFLTGDMKGVNVVLPIVGTDFDEMMQQYVLPFEAAGYNVKARFCPAKANEAAARVVMRELGGGQLINSAVAFNFGDGPENVYNALKDRINAFGEPYGIDEESAIEPAA